MRLVASPVTLAALGIVLLMCVSCRPSAAPDSPEVRPSRERPATPLPTRETTIDPVTRKLDAAQLEAERRRSEIDQAGK
jgi:hypothetical protein